MDAIRLVVLQVSLSFILLVAAAWLAESLKRLENKLRLRYDQRRDDRSSANSGRVRCQLWVGRDYSDGFSIT